MTLESFHLTFAADPPAQGAASGPIRFSGVAYSGGVVPSYGWLGDVAIDLATMQNADGAEIPVLVDHDGRIDSIAGKGRIVRAAGDDGPCLRIEGELTSATEAGGRIASLLAEGYPLQLSVGMSANIRETNQPVTVNGRAVKVAAVFENPLIREVSFVAVGADPNTSAAQFSIHPSGQKEGRTMELNEAKAMIEAQQAENASLKAELDALKAQAKADAEARRKADLKSLFTALGKDAPEGDAAKPYLDMTDAQFAAYSTDLKAVAKVPDQALFSAQSLAHGGQSPTKTPGELLMAAVTNLSKRG